MNAEQIFKDLGYEKSKETLEELGWGDVKRNNELIRYQRHNYNNFGNPCDYILFDLKKKLILGYTESGANLWFTPKELIAINELTKELGWID